jgi:hypothetical protein
METVRSEGQNFQLKEVQRLEEEEKEEEEEVCTKRFRYKPAQELYK